MKTKLFYLFTAIFLFSFSGKSQNPIITLIGAGNGGWTDDKETPMLTSDGITYTLVGHYLIGGEVKFREGKCWEAGCAAVVPAVSNSFGWGPVKAVAPAVQGTGWPSGVNNAPAANGPNIVAVKGVWDITFNRTTGSWSFVATPLPTVKLFGTATTPTTGVAMTPSGSTSYELKKVALKAGNAQFEINTTPAGAPTLQILGGNTFPNGVADDAAKFIPVSPANDYDVTVDFTSGAYTFKVATFPTIALVGSAAGGWPGTTDNPGPIDNNQMATTDGVTYTLNNVPIIGGTDRKCVFRGGNAWNIKYGQQAGFPTGTNANGQDIEVFNTASTGTYDITLNAVTGAYTFTKITYAIVGSGVGGWPGDPGNPGPVDVHQLSTVDGVNYTKSGLVVTTSIAKFRPNNAWSGDWGGDTFPAGTKTGNNIPTVAGTYNLTVNVLTGSYDFGTALAVKNFNAGSFKVYPNPAKTSWNITSNDDITSVQVYDMVGKSVYARTAASKEVTVNASELSNGVYFAKVSTANGSSTVKLIKE